MNLFRKVGFLRVSLKNERTKMNSKYTHLHHSFLENQNLFIFLYKHGLLGIYNGFYELNG